MLVTLAEKFVQIVAPELLRNQRGDIEQTAADEQADIARAQFLEHDAVQQRLLFGAHVRIIDLRPGADTETLEAFENTPQLRIPGDYRLRRHPVEAHACRAHHLHGKAATGVPDRQHLIRQPEIEIETHRRLHGRIP